jgi:hypothetical protein
MIVPRTSTDGAVAVHTPAKQPSIKAWQEATRAAATIERIGPGEYLVESASRAGKTYTVNIRTQSCGCIAAAHGRRCYHLARGEKAEAWHLARELRRLQQEYGDVVFHLAVEEMA